MNLKSLPKQSECKSFQKPEALNYLKTVVNLLEQCKSSWNSEDVDFLLSRISNSYHDYYHQFIDVICDYYVKRDLCKLLLVHLNKSIQTDGIVTPLTTIVYGLLINLSDISEIFAQSILSSQLFNLIVDNFFTIESLNNDNPNNKEFIIQSVIIISNIARNPQNTVHYRVSGIKRMMEKFIRQDCDDDLGLNAILVLSYLVDESEVGQLDNGLHIIKNLLKHIKHVYDTKERQSGFTVKELVHGLHCISCNDNMKIRIDEEGGIPILIDILRSEREDTYEAALGTIENLCFIDKLSLKLKNEYSIEKVIKDFAKSHCENIKKSYNGILWRVQNKAKSFHKTESQKKGSNRTYSFDVFLSYAWANKPRIREIFQKLKSNKIRVWIDEEQMEGSTCEAMAHGIENSKLFILSVSSLYMKSKNCRHEAEYAYQIDKPIIPIIMESKYKPDSWLGFIMGAKLYYEFSGRRNIAEELKKLRKAIQETLETKETIKEDNNQYELKIIESEFIIHSIKCKNWSEIDVSKWLEDWQMGYLKKHFAGIDGSFLQTMLILRKTSPEYFNNSLKNEFDLKFFEVVKLHKALNELEQ